MHNIPVLKKKGFTPEKEKFNQIAAKRFINASFEKPHSERLIC